MAEFKKGQMPWNKKQRPPKEFLIEQYVNQHKSVDKIAEELKVGKTTLHRWFKEYNIIKRTSAESILPRDFRKPPKEELMRLYKEEGKSVAEIAKSLHVSSPTIRLLLEKHGLKVRSSKEQFVFGKNLPDKQTLGELRCIKKLSFEKIGKMFGFKSGGPIKRLCREYKISYKKPVRKYPPNYWTKEKIIGYIKNLKAKGESLRSWDIRNNHTSISHASYKLFNNWQKAVEASGIDYTSLLKNPWKWNKENIKEKLIELHKKKIRLSDIGLRKYDNTFHSTVTRKFGSVYDALEYAGIDSSLYRIKHNNKFWTEERVLAEAKKLKDSGADLSSQNIRKKYSKLWNVSMKNFGGWINVLRKIGIKPDEISRLYANTKEFKKYLEDELTSEKLNELYCKQRLTELEIGDMYGCGYKPIQRLMRKFGIKARDSKYGIKGKLICKDGHKVRSSHERRIDNWFYSNGIPHEVEVSIIKGRKFTADFKVGRFLIEVYGLHGHKNYDYRVSQKEDYVASKQNTKSIGYVVLNNEKELQSLYELKSEKQINEKWGNNLIFLIIKPTQFVSNKEIEKWFGFLIKVYSTQSKLV